MTSSPSRPEIVPGMSSEGVRGALERWVEAHVPGHWIVAARQGPEELRRSRTREEYELWYPTLGRAGLVKPAWPCELGGLGVADETATLIESELRYLALTKLNKIGLNNAAAALFAFGTTDQRARYLPPIVSNEEKWCQLFSEPGAGSDLASLATKAIPDGEMWRICGQKVWTTWADTADFAILLARTDPAQPKHKGITYFLLDMHLPGVTVRPLYQMTGGSEFNEVFLDDVMIPDSMRLGPVGEGWRVAGATLSSERQMVSGESGISAPLSRTLRLLLSGCGRAYTPEERQRIASLYAEERIRVWTNARVTAKLASGQGPGPAASIGKIHQSDLNQRLQAMASDVTGMASVAWPNSDDGASPGGPIGYRAGMPDVVHNYLRSRANTIEGGSSEINRNVLGERVLGLPKEPDPWRGQAWDQVPRS